MLFSERALKLIVQFEGINQPKNWPGGASGITLGYGYDLGHVTAAQFETDWGTCFIPEQVTRLECAIGKTGQDACRLAPSFSDIRCTAADSKRVLVEHSLPLYVETTRAAFRGFDMLPLDVQGALVSLVYNRGPSMRDKPGTDNRREMRAIRDLVADGMVAGIADQIRSMKRLWQGAGLDGLLARRDAEAALIESAAAALLRALSAIPRQLRSARKRRAPASAPKSKLRAPVECGLPDILGAVRKPIVIGRGYFRPVASVAKGKPRTAALDRKPRSGKRS